MAEHTNVDGEMKSWWIAFTTRDGRQEIHISEDAMLNYVAAHATHKSQPDEMRATLAQMNMLAKAAINCGVWVCWCDDGMNAPVVVQPRTLESDLREDR